MYNYCNLIFKNTRIPLQKFLTNIFTIFSLITNFNAIRIYSTVSVNPSLLKQLVILTIKDQMIITSADIDTMIVITALCKIYNKNIPTLQIYDSCR